MEEMTMNRIELLPDRWRPPPDPRYPGYDITWAIYDLEAHLFYAGLTPDELHQYIKENPDEKEAIYALEYLEKWRPTVMAKALRDAAFKIESLTVKPESESRN